MQHAPVAQEHPQNLEMSLREQLLAAGASGSGPAPYPPASTAPTNAENPYQHSDSASPHDQYDHSTGGQQPYGKRELSTSKRAAQNRAAQRAFRQRKEGYIKKLEEQVKEFETMEQNFRALQNENYQLREYILSLQSRLLENQSDFPPAPSHINLPTGSHGASSRPPDSSSAVEQQLRREMQHHGSQQSGPMQHDGMSQLQAAAAQAAESRPDAPYGLGSRPRAEEARAGGDDTKSSS